MAGSLRWQIRFDVAAADITVAIRMDQPQPLDYYLLPRQSRASAEDNGVSLDSYRFECLEAFYGLAARTDLLEVA